MNTLHFYTKRIFALICLFFFGFLILIASRGPTESLDAEFSSKEWVNQKKNQKYEKHPKYIGRMAKRPGEQLEFQPQPAPAAGIGLIPYSDTDVARNIDEEMIRRFNVHLGGIDLKKLAVKACGKNITLAKYWGDTQGREVPERDNWEKFYASIGTCDLYRDEVQVQDLLDDLNRMPLKHVAIMEGGTQTKLIFTFENEKQAVFKPMRFGRDYETDPNHFYFGDFERHTAEIATFHLDKILGFRRAVPTAGRVVNMTSELLEKAEKKLKKTFFISPAKNHCFVGKCDYYCDTTHAVCGDPDLKEGSVQMFLPDDTSVPRKHNKSPYRRTYSKKAQLAQWQTDMSYCNAKVKTKPPYAHGRSLLDLVDLHILDYLIGNQDRHHYETFNVFDDIPPYAMHLDNGRAFGKTKFDDDDILMPLRQCCVIRPGTLATLLNFYKGPKSLTEAFHESLSKDPIAPVLAYKHYPAIERRLEKILQYTLTCLDEQNAENVIMNEYHNPKVFEFPVPKREEDDDETAPEQNQNPAEEPAGLVIPKPVEGIQKPAENVNQAANPNGHRMEESA
ncbi:unnamed protein product [Bursaphelenchus okinawaensis]|uniref:FAM20 C-terminal domain-containing protein n=1 Tax=Bursaphelenchus okinawaensis TaxID=465554 RepID=A0A811KLD3_9BILA|nr:unnamed protein product [Bursaphelenchus okinawaensis]CAG9106133.1 unnamed protein product [Bursaphelenchus okinawaensis]